MGWNRGNTGAEIQNRRVRCGKRADSEPRKQQSEAYEDSRSAVQWAPERKDHRRGRWSDGDMLSKV